MKPRSDVIKIKYACNMKDIEIYLFLNIFKVNFHSLEMGSHSKKLFKCIRGHEIHVVKMYKMVSVWFIAETGTRLSIKIKI